MSILCNVQGKVTCSTEDEAWLLYLSGGESEAAVTEVVTSVCVILAPGSWVLSSCDITASAETVGCGRVWGEVVQYLCR